MDRPKLESVVSNIDHRLTVIEQILPTLATKEDLRAAIAPLPTREDIVPLPTREEMYQAIHSVVRQEGEQTRRHFDVVAESLRGDIRLIAKVDRRVTRLEAARK